MAKIEILASGVRVTPQTQTQPGCRLALSIACSVAIQTGFLFPAMLSAQEIINVAPLGSYASAMPDTTEIRERGAFFGRTVDQMELLYENMDLDPDLRGAVPIPTNTWWSDILFGDRSYFDSETGSRIPGRDPLGGQVWFLPGMVDPKESGLEVYFPNTWQGSSTATWMQATQPLLVGGRVLPPETDAVVFEDFELDTYLPDWTLSGDAVGATPRSQEEVPQFNITPIQGAYHATTYNLGGKGYASIAELSRSFVITKSYLHLLVGGGNASQDTYVSIEVNGEEIHRAHGQNGPTMQWANWDLSSYAGSTATLRIVDDSNATWGFIMCDQIVLSNDPGEPEALYNTEFSPTTTTVRGWGDWHLDFDLHDDSGNAYDISVMRGSPAIWFSYEGSFIPVIDPPSGGNWLDADGQEVAFPFSGGGLVFEKGGRRYGVLAPDGSTFTGESSGTLLIETPEALPHFVVVLLAPGQDLDTFETAAWRKPVDTQLVWDYDATAGEVTTTFAVETLDLLTGAAGLPTLCGWIPHHYDAGALDAVRLGNPYATPRGDLYASISNNATVTYPFAGLVPALPMPDTLDPSIVQDFLISYPVGEVNDPETYAGGKAMLRAAKHMHAGYLIDEPRSANIENQLKAALVDWFTYDGSSDDRFFARYEDYRALVGYRFGFGSQAFNDHHFHYGYFSTVLGLLGIYDADFVKDYGNFATLIVKEYANWDRTDTDFPMFRNFDAWEGHSWAGGTSSPNGQNQESTSEAIQSWVGMFLLGSAIDDTEMMKAGAMGYAVETAATSEYWYRSGGNLPDNYEHEVVGILGSSGITFGTFFGDDPAWIFGIQWTPSNIWWDFLGKDPAAPAALIAATDAERVTDGLAPGVLNYGDDSAIWTHYSINLMAMGDPQGAAALVDQAILDDVDVIASDTRNGLITYGHTRAYAQLGLRNFDAHTSMPTSSVYQDPVTGKNQYVIFNPGSVAATAQLFDGGSTVGQVSVPPLSLVSGPFEITYSSWMLSRYPTASEAERQPGSDLDLDGGLNLYEYALGSDPGDSNDLPAAARLIPGSPTGIPVTFSIERGAMRADVNYGLERSTDLSGWEKLESAATVSSENLLEFPLPEPEIDETSAFYRLELELEE